MAVASVPQPPLKPIIGNLCKLDLKRSRVWTERSRIADLFRQGAIIYLCGDGLRMAPAVRDALIGMYRERPVRMKLRPRPGPQLVERERGRYVSDVLA